VKVEEKTPTQLGPLERANLNHWTFFIISIVWYSREHDVSGTGSVSALSSHPPSPEDGNRSSFRNVVFSTIPDDGKLKKKQ
jgi:hypothetical protein